MRSSQVFIWASSARSAALAGGAAKPGIDLLFDGLQPSPPWRRARERSARTSAEHAISLWSRSAEKVVGLGGRRGRFRRGRRRPRGDERGDGEGFLQGGHGDEAGGFERGAPSRRWWKGPWPVADRGAERSGAAGWSAWAEKIAHEGRPPVTVTPRWRKKSPKLFDRAAHAFSARRLPMRRARAADVRAGSCFRNSAGGIAVRFSLVERLHGFVEQRLDGFPERAGAFSWAGCDGLGAGGDFHWRRACSRGLPARIRGAPTSIRGAGD